VILHLVTYSLAASFSCFLANVSGNFVTCSIPSVAIFEKHFGQLQWIKVFADMIALAK